MDAGLLIQSACFRSLPQNAAFSTGYVTVFSTAGLIWAQWECIVIALVLCVQCQFE